MKRTITILGIVTCLAGSTLLVNGQSTNTPVVADTRFSVDRGFFDQPFHLEITSATPGAAIYYSLDCSEPGPGHGRLYATGIEITNTTVVRARAYRNGYQPTGIDTRTYLFLSDVLTQAADWPTTRKPPANFPASWGQNSVDYGMDPNVIKKYNATEWREALTQIPSMSLVTKMANLFDASTGIYANASGHGEDWERPGSIELLDPAQENPGRFQAPCGLRIRGGYSRNPQYVKHSFRVFFRAEYGLTKLHYPLFEEDGAKEFDTFDLRTSQNYSWPREGDSNQGKHDTMVREVFCRQTLGALGQPYRRSRYYHLYLNGQYWGLYETDERPEASFGATYLGGAKEDYDVVKCANHVGGFVTEVTDGDVRAWSNLWTAARSVATNSSNSNYFRILGCNSDGSRNPALPVLLEVDNLIDYMLAIFYSGDGDATLSSFLGNNMPNNWFGLRNRNNPDQGFMFVNSDCEHTLGAPNSQVDRTGPFGGSNQNRFTYANPQWIHEDLMHNKEYRLRFADHVQRHFFNGGALTPEAGTNRFLAKANQITKAIRAYSARWGDVQKEPPYGETEWTNMINQIARNWFPGRTTLVLNQLKNDGLYPALAAPVLSQHGGGIPLGYALSLSGSTADAAVYYTLDGSDPRLVGDGIRPSASRYEAPVVINRNTRVKTRTLKAGSWSALEEADLLIPNSQPLAITEIMYHPAPPANGSKNVVDDFQFLELLNAGTEPLNLAGIRFIRGLQFTFTDGMLGAGQRVVLVKNRAAFESRYGSNLPIAGVFTNSLSHGGERLTLVGALHEGIVDFSYSDSWDPITDGYGFSLVIVDERAPFNTWGNSKAWGRSGAVGGSPGAPDVPSAEQPIIINEILTHSLLVGGEAIELFNPGSQAVDISGWYLTDDHADWKKFPLPSGTVVPAHGYWVINETQYNPSTGTGFALSDRGEEVHLFSADSGGTLTGYRDGFSFGAAAESITFGRYTNSVGEIQYPAQRTATLGSVNGDPLVGPVVINELQYAPAPGEDEFIEVKNRTDQPMKLFDTRYPTNAWRLNGVGFDFPTNAEIDPRGLALVVPIDPAAFRTRYHVPAAVPIFGPYAGALQDNGELVQLQRPGVPELDKNGAVVVPFITVDAVRYNDRLPWPTNAHGAGFSLERVKSDAYGNDPQNWRASLGPASPGLDNNGNRPPTATAGPAQELATATVPVRVSLHGSGTDDGSPKPPGALTASWRQVSGPGVVVFESANQFDTAVSLPGLGTYVFGLTVSDGELEATEVTTVTVSRPSSQQMLIATGAEWKYLDDGSNQGTNWTAAGFDDRNWKSGAAELGYGDGNEVTVVRYGPNSSAKYTTTYFRKQFVVTGASGVTALNMKLLRDDGAVIWLNGREVVRDNMPSGSIAYTTLASTSVNDTAETTYYDWSVAPGVLREGTNTIAVEIHQSSGSSTDISFDLSVEMQGNPVNQAPVVIAGEDQSLAWPAAARLSGTYTDDALPNPPGIATHGWTKVSGPGTVTFDAPDRLATGAIFSESGEYLLRLTVNDGALSGTDDVRIVLASQPAVEPKFENIEVISDPGLAVRLRFIAAAQTAYILQCRDSLTEGDWQKLKDIAAEPAKHAVEISDPVPAERPSRFYRLVAL